MYDILAPEQADKLPIGSVILINRVAALQRDDHGGWSMAGASGSTPGGVLLPADFFPATVVYIGGDVWLDRLTEQVDAIGEGD